ncbi:MAG: NAD(P)H-hydrate dehydratase [Firmicutes bacterium]|nr:NAD(P)H-hydrate dehydratase [Bacillota bacterium]
MKIVSAAEMRSMDQAAINDYSIPGVVLMENAGLRLAEVIRKGNYGLHIMVVAGSGNNGGDGFVVARHLSQEKNVSVWLTVREEDYSGDALTNLKILKKMGVKINSVYKKEMLADFIAELQKADLVVDALFGTGLCREVSGIYYDIIHSINQSKIPVIAVDIPSGVCADTGQILGIAIKARETVTFALPKLGHFLYPGADQVGVLHVKKISIPAVLEEKGSVQLLTSELISLLVPSRRSDSHKGTFGAVLLVAGSSGMSGAATLAARAALRGGCGLLYAAVPGSIQSVVAAQVAEAITIPLPVNAAGQLDATALTTLLKRSVNCQAVAVGPGLTQEQELLPLIAGLVRECKVPLVLDADALNLLALAPEALQERQAPTIITPHPGEAARLLGSTVAEIQRNRLRSARELAARFGSTVILKGAYSIIAESNGTAAINPTGNNGMATAGSGDVLTGLAASLLAQGVTSAQAAQTAAYLHGLAADLAVKEIGERSLLASDIVRYIPQAYLAVQANKYKV